MLLDAYDMAAFIANRRGDRHFYSIGTDGPGASGKTYLADRIGTELTEVQIVHFDDFYLNEHDATAEHAVGHRFDWARLEQQVLSPLSNNHKGYYQVYDWRADKLGTWKTVVPEGILVVEGVYSTRKELRQYYDLTIFVSADYETRLQRGIDRDGVSSKDKWIKEWMPEEMEYMRSEHYPRASADIEIDGERIAT